MDRNDKNDDLRDRVKTLSPGMMVYKRFIRNRLAIIGIVILVAMFAFSFLGSFLYPYGETQVFVAQEYIDLDYAVAAYSTDLRFTEAEGMTFPEAARAQFMLAAAQGGGAFTHDGIEYFADPHDKRVGPRAREIVAYTIHGFLPLAEADVFRNRIVFQPSDLLDVTAELQAAFETAYQAQETAFDFDGARYTILYAPRKATIARFTAYALASRLVADAYDPADAAFVQSYAFRYWLNRSYTFPGFPVYNTGEKIYRLETYTDETGDTVGGTVYDRADKPLAEVSGIVVNPVDGAVFLPMGFKHAVREAIAQGDAFFTDASVTGADTRYDVHRLNDLYYIKTQTETSLIQIFQPPSARHPLGTDPTGMDMLARLMYGGRISLTVGFVVILIELLIGVVFGGVSGYFSGWVDTLMMRFVDLFNALPQLPLMLIMASVMDVMKVPPMQRLYFLMLLMGLLGWTGIARIVRGQILSLREQDFMLAAEASGLRVSRRIFKHLIPNVMPLLIVNATMSLGSVILLEATLSFLGLGIKFPLATWGSISNNATNITTLRYYPWTWIPAGLLIFITVLGFNFVGDGLRDAFDPKMKR